MEPEREKRKYKKKDREEGGYLGGFLAIFFIIGIFLGLKYFTSENDKKVAGVKTNLAKEQQLEKEKEKKAKENVKEDLNNRLEKIKEDINDLNAVDVTTKSPQVKKIIEDLQSLQNLPKDQAKNVCQQICSNFE